MESIWEWYLGAERKGWSEDAAEDAMEFAQNDLDEINTVIAHAKLLRGRIDELEKIKNPIGDRAMESGCELDNIIYDLEVSAKALAAVEGDLGGEPHRTLPERDNPDRGVEV